jgi:excinuclease UvrABC helicase subunit UvrB
MTLVQLEAKMDRIEKQMYREISKGNFDKADKLRNQYVDLSVKSLEMRMK